MLQSHYNELLYCKNLLITRYMTLNLYSLCISLLFSIFQLLHHSSASWPFIILLFHHSSSFLIIHHHCHPSSSFIILQFHEAMHLLFTDTCSNHLDLPRAQPRCLTLMFISRVATSSCHFLLFRLRARLNSLMPTKPTLSMDKLDRVSWNYFADSNLQLVLWNASVPFRYSGVGSEPKCSGHEILSITSQLQHWHVQ